jgi:hypothetical protein
VTASRAKGTKAETAVVNWLQAHGWPHTERHAQHGSKDIGDVNGIPGCVIEVKSASRIDLSGWLHELDDEMGNAAVDCGVVIIKRRGTTNVAEWYALMPVGVWAVMAKDAGL